MLTLVSANLALERDAVIVTAPPFSEISAADEEKVTSGSSSSLIWKVLEISSPKSTLEITLESSSGSVLKAKVTVISSIASSRLSSIPVKVTVVFWVFGAIVAITVDVE